MHGSSFKLCQVFLWVALWAFAACNSGAAHRIGTEPQSPSSSTGERTLVVAITAIDGKEIAEGKIPEVGRQVIVEGTISDESAMACVLVHPMTTDTWWVQNLPAPPDKIDADIWKWRTMALFGTPTLGKMGNFELVAIAEPSDEVRYCQRGKQIKMHEFPRHAPRSRIITVFRTRN